jgi:hypothetical protein
MPFAKLHIIAKAKAKFHAKIHPSGVGAVSSDNGGLCRRRWK